MMKGAPQEVERAERLRSQRLYYRLSPLCLTPGDDPVPAHVAVRACGHRLR